MTYSPVYVEPAGYVWSVIEQGDSLASLEAESGVPAPEIARKNGVPFFGVKSCAWSRDISAWVLGVGLDDREQARHPGAPPNRLRVGERRPFSAEQRNACEADGRFPSFVVGQVVLLPRGLRRAFNVASDVQDAERAGSTALKVFGGLLAVGVGAAVVRRVRKSSTRKAA